MKTEELHNVSKNFWKTKWGIFLIIVFLPISFCYFIWTRKNWDIRIRLTIFCILGLIVLIVWVNEKIVMRMYESAEYIPTPVQQQVPVQGNSQPTSIPTEEPTSPPIATNTPIPMQVQQASNHNPAPATSETISQRNAVAKAKDYLSYTAFSHDGLVDQLEYEQFSHDDAMYGADHSSANWDDQAAKKAKDYMEYSAFSRGSLIDQLMYDKFTQEQAAHGADSVGL